MSNKVLGDKIKEYLHKVILWDWEEEEEEVGKELDELIEKANRVDELEETYGALESDYQGYKRDFEELLEEHNELQSELEGCNEAGKLAFGAYLAIRDDAELGKALKHAAKCGHEIVYLDENNIMVKRKNLPMRGLEVWYEQQLEKEESNELQRQEDSSIN